MEAMDINAIDEDDVPNAGAKRRFDFTANSHYVHTLIEGETEKFLAEYDLVVVLAVHPTACPMCETAFVQFKEVAEEFYTDAKGTNKRLLGGVTPTKAVKFVLLNTEYEMEELEEILKIENINTERLPLLLVLKQEFVNVLKRPPVSFVINDLLSRRFPRFLLRLAGTSPRAVVGDDELVTRIAHSATQRVSIGIWANDIPPSLHPLFVESRFDLLLHAFPSVKDANPDLVTKFNPTNADLVVYHYKGPYDVTSLSEAERAQYLTMTPYTFNRNITSYRLQGEHQAKMLSKVMKIWSVVRPGHEMDFIRKTTVVDGPFAEGCRRAVAGDRIQAKIIGRVTLTGTLFMDTREAAFVVGEDRNDMPSYVTTKALVGMCPGQRRRVGFPPGKAYPDENVRPQGVSEDDGVTFFIEMEKYLGENDVVRLGPIDSLNPDPNTEL